MSAIYSLYVKTHQVTGLKYLGVTTNSNPLQYLGSGLHWRHHLKKHGKLVETKIIGTYANSTELKKDSLFYSLIWNVVESQEWANLIIETGENGVPKGYKHSRLACKRMSESKKIEWKKPEQRLKRIKGLKTAASTTAYKKSHSLGAKSTWASGGKRRIGFDHALVNIS